MGTKKTTVTQAQATYSARSSINGQHFTWRDMHSVQAIAEANSILNQRKAMYLLS